MAGEGQLRIQYKAKDFLLLDPHYWSTIKKGGRVIRLNSLFGGHLECLFSCVRIKGHVPVVCPQLDEIQIMVHINSSRSRDREKACISEIAINIG